MRIMLFDDWISSVRTATQGLRCGATGTPLLGLRFRSVRDRSKMRSMAGCLPTPKRFHHGRPDRGR